MGTELSKAIQATEKTQEYDNNIKFILSQKIILAHILIGTTQEFAGMRPEEILAYIEEGPQIGNVFVEPGLTNILSKIQGGNTEDAVPGEGSITYDVKFYAKYLGKQKKGKENKFTKLLFDIEAQKDFYPGYDLVTRGIFYAARQISAQKGTEFEKSDYDNMKKVYSIWICLSPPKYCENTIMRYSFQKQSLYGRTLKGHFRYDLMEVIFINLPRAVPEEEAEPTLTGMLKTLFSPELSKETIMDRLENIYHIPMSDELEGGINAMCNFGEAILERGLKQGAFITLISLVQDGLLSVEEAARRVNMSEEDFIEKMESDCKDSCKAAESM